ncbi:MAG TPA: alpha/beta fold hydrolase [Gemmatimonadales bacterium]|nr:alpha/beta fold hydrolase [Gemmatimonadales bacterium]
MWRAVRCIAACWRDGPPGREPPRSRRADEPGAGRRPGRRAVALDLRGHGRSDPPEHGDYAIESLAADVAAVADALSLERFALVGLSLGGGVALAYAGMHPERVDRLLLLDAIGDGTRLPAEQMEPFLAALDSPAYTETIEGYWASISGPPPGPRSWAGSTPSPASTPRPPWPAIPAPRSPW